MNILTNQKKAILSDYVENQSLTSVKKLYNAVKVLHKDIGITQLNCQTFLKEYKATYKVAKVTHEVRHKKPRAIIPHGGTYLNLDYNTMDMNSLQQFCATHDIPLDGISDNKEAIVQLINYIMPLEPFHKDMNIEALWVVLSSS